MRDGPMHASSEDTENVVSSAQGDPKGTGSGYSDHRPASPDTILRLLVSRRGSGDSACNLDPDRDELWDRSPDPDDDPAEIGAAVLLDRAFARKPEVYERILSASPVLIIDCPSEIWIEPIADVLKQIFGPGSAAAELVEAGFRGVGSGAIIVEAQSMKKQRDVVPCDRAVRRALRCCQPLIAVSAPGRDQLPAELERSWEDRISLGHLEPSDLALITLRIVGHSPSGSLAPSIAMQVDPMDLRIAMHPARGADGSMDRLRGIVERRVAKQTANGAPRLSDLHGYGGAAEWGIAAAADLAAFGRGELSWSECEPGALLSGPPGVGKTIFASALAKQAGASFLASSLAQWQAEGDAHLGTTLKAMRGFFRKAREIAPCVALVDELDSFGDRRRISDRNHDYGVQVINGFLECLDGDGGRAGVLIVGATNDAARIDPAILRSGRFDRVIAIARPTLDELPFILRHHLGSDLASSDLRNIARRALGGTGADCAAWVRRARGRARRAGRAVGEDDLLREIEEVVGTAGEEDERRTAIHECGHAVAARTLGLSFGDLVLLSPGHAGNGYASLSMPTVATRDVLRNVLIVLMAGRAAEILVFGSPSAGAASDLCQATTLAHNIHVLWGLGRRLSAHGGRSLDSMVDHSVEQALQSASRSALSLLKMRRRRLEHLAEILRTRRSLAAIEVEELLR